MPPWILIYNRNGRGWYPVDGNIIPADRNFPWNPGLTSKGGVVSGSLLRQTIYQTVNPSTASWSGNATLSGPPFNAVTFNIGSSLVNDPAHGLASNTQVQFYSDGTLPTGITQGNAYYVISVDADHYQISATSGPGSAVSFSGTSTGNNARYFFPVNTYIGKLHVNSTSSGTMATGLTVYDTSSPPNCLGVVAASLGGGDWTINYCYRGCFSSASMVGMPDDTSRLQGIVNSCPSGQVVKLAAGTFVIGSVTGINSQLFLPSNITLRGSGAGTTFLHKPNAGWPRDNRNQDGTSGAIKCPMPPATYDNGPVIFVAPSTFPWGADDATIQLIGSDVPQGAMSVTLPDASAYTAGNFCVLDEMSGSVWQDTPPGFGNNNDNLSTSIVSGTYISSNGLVTLTLSAAAYAYPLDTINISSLTGSGTNLSNLNGTYSCTSGTRGTSSTTVTYTAASGLGSISITGGNLVVGPVGVPKVYQGDRVVWNIHYPVQVFQDDASTSDSNAPLGAAPILFSVSGISGNTMTTTGSPSLAPGMRIFGPGIANPTGIVKGSGNSWTIAPPQTVGAISAVAYDTGGTYGFCRPDRPFCEMKEIASVVGNVVTFTSPVSATYRANLGATLVTFTNSHSGQPSVPFMTLVGVEELTVSGGGNGNIRFQMASYCWCRNVEATEWVGENFNLNNTFRCEIRDCYSHVGSQPTPCGGGYSISHSNAASESLIENNIILDANKVMVFRSSGTGSVVGYNYGDNGWISFNTGYTECGMNASHLNGSHHVLFEGNYCFNCDSDYTHGNSTYVIHFRNWYSGQRRDFLDFAVRCIGAASYSFKTSYIANVLGYSAKPSWISSLGVAGTTAANGWGLTSGAMNCDVSGGNCIGNGGNAWLTTVWAIGYDPARFVQSAEPICLATMIRNGNYDYYTAAQHFYDGSARSYPSSMYLQGTPWFMSKPTVLAWPCVNEKTGAVTLNAAHTRYNNGTPNTPSLP